jgi:hypothetical protein
MHDICIINKISLINVNKIIIKIVILSSKVPVVIRKNIVLIINIAAMLWLKINVNKIIIKIVILSSKVPVVIRKNIVLIINIAAMRARAVYAAYGSKNIRRCTKKHNYFIMFWSVPPIYKTKIVIVFKILRVIPTNFEAQQLLGFLNKKKTKLCTLLSTLYDVHPSLSIIVIIIIIIIIIILDLSFVNPIKV